MCPNEYPTYIYIYTRNPHLTVSYPPCDGVFWLCIVIDGTAPR